MSTQAEAGTEQVTAERDGYERLFIEAARLLDEHGLLIEFRRRMDALDRTAGLEP